MQSPEGHVKRYRQSGVWVQTSTIKEESTTNVSELLCWPGSDDGIIANTGSTIDSAVALPVHPSGKYQGPVIWGI